MTRTAIAVAAAVLGSGCCGTWDEAPPAWQTDQAEEVDPVDLASTFMLRTDAGQAVVLRATETALIGPDVSLEHFCDPSGTAIRGRLHGRPVDISILEDHVTGLVGSGPLALTVTPRGHALLVTGVVHGDQTRFLLGPRALSGTIGQCAYDLHRTDTGYEGRRSCGGPTAHTWLRIPTALDHWGDDARATVVAMLLASG